MGSYLKSQTRLCFFHFCISPAQRRNKQPRLPFLRSRLNSEADEPEEADEAVLAMFATCKSLQKPWWIHVEPSWSSSPRHVKSGNQPITQKSGLRSSCIIWDTCGTNTCTIYLSTYLSVCLSIDLSIYYNLI